MDDFKKRNTTGVNYLKDKLAAASVKMGMSGGDIPDIDIAVMKGTNRDRVSFRSLQRMYTDPCIILHTLGMRSPFSNVYD